MIYALMYCYLATGNCFLYRGNPDFIFFHSLEACQKMADLRNTDSDKSQKAVCFQKESWRPASAQ